MGSSRLPGKLLAPLAGRTVFDWIARRLRASAVEKWWVATTTRRDDDVTAAWGAALGLEVFRGDPDDVLSRFVAIAQRERPEWIVRVTGDNPFVDAGVVNELVGAAAMADAAVRHLGPPARNPLPLGYAPEVVRADALVSLAERNLPAHHRAHVTSAIREGGGSGRWDPPAAWPSRPHWRWTVDTLDDLVMADAAFRAFGAAGSSIDYPAMVRCLDAMPEVTTRNATVEQRRVTEG